MLRVGVWVKGKQDEIFSRIFDCNQITLSFKCLRLQIGKNHRKQKF